MSDIGVGTAPGKHCAHPGCNALDFLPYRCDGCSATFCADHRTYASHNCASPGTVSREVPRCPLCQTEVALKQGQSLDQAVNDHINAGCKKNAGKGKTYGNACSKKGCKKKEVIPVVCKRCGRNFCLSHRFEADHNCEGSAARVDDRASAAERRRAESQPKARAQPQPPASRPPAATRFGTPPARGLAAGSQPRQGRAGQGNASELQGGMSEEEALAMALAASAQDAGRPPQGRSPARPAASAPRPPATGADADLELALAMSASLAEEEQKKEAKKDCSMM
eukprot:m.10579 g.10579  ORF g.10579 m.10579 type:complete len:281 (+) comp4335_c0_seq1:176-1018(+)